MKRFTFKALAVFAAAAVAASLGACNNIKITDEQLKKYQENIEEHSHFSNDYIAGKPREEVTAVIPKAGVDYSPEAVKEAFAQIYVDAATYTAVEVNDFRVNTTNLSYSASVEAPEAERRNETGFRPNIAQIDISDIEAFSMYDESGKGDIIGGSDVGDNDDESGKGDIIGGSDVGDNNDHELFLDGAETIEAAGYEASSVKGQGWYYDEDGNLIINADKIMKAKEMTKDYYTTVKQYYRDALSSKQQLVYDILMSAMQRGAFQVVCDFGVNDEETNDVLWAIRLDHPEMFFIDMYAFTSTEEIDEKTGEKKLSLTSITITFDEEIMAIGVETAMNRVRNAAAEPLAQAKKLSSNIEKVKYLYDYLCENVKYADDATNCKYSQNVYGGLVTKDTVCAGYAASLHYLAAQLGIPLTRINSCSHQWNMVELDGEFYYLDATWGDAKDYENNRPISYDWFNFTDKYAQAFMDKTKSTMHKRDYLSSLLPKAEGTKYSFDNWFGKDEDSTKQAEKTKKATKTEKADETTHTDESTDWITSGDPSLSDEYRTNESGSKSTTESIDEPSENNSESTKKSDEYAIELDEYFKLKDFATITDENGTLYAEAEDLITALVFDRGDGTVLPILTYEYDPDENVINVYSWATETLSYYIDVENSVYYVVVDNFYQTLESEQMEYPVIVDGGKIYLPVAEMLVLPGFDAAVLD